MPAVGVDRAADPYVFYHGLIASGLSVIAMVGAPAIAQFTVQSDLLPPTFGQLTDTYSGVLTLDGRIIAKFSSVTVSLGPTAYTRVTLHTLGQIGPGFAGRTARAYVGPVHAFAGLLVDQPYSTDLRGTGGVLAFDATVARPTKESLAEAKALAQSVAAGPIFVPAPAPTAAPHVASPSTSGGVLGQLGFGNLTLGEKIVGGVLAAGLVLALVRGK
jgi:hypothetical protein